MRSIRVDTSPPPYTTAGLVGNINSPGPYPQSFAKHQMARTNISSHQDVGVELQPITFPSKTYSHLSRSITIRETSPPYIHHQYTSQLYSHLPLPQHASHTKAIRVLDLDPVPLSSINNSTSRLSLDQQPLTGTLRTIDFATCPDFTALSYVWGAPSDEDFITIRCDDGRGLGGGGTCKIPITRNCRDALVSLRKLHGCSSRNRDSGRANESKEANEQVLTVWVDAICINQQDEREKPGQIALMGEVYTWASKVWVWLGPACPNISPNASPTRYEGDSKGERKVKRAIIGLKRAAKLRATPPGMPWIDSSMHGKQQGHGPRTTFQDALLACRSLARVFVRLWLRETFAQLRKYFIMCYACFTSAHASDLLEPNDLEYLLDREWLHRAWTFQEIILASNPFILCGDESITWTELQQGLDCLSCLKPTFLLRGFLRFNPLNNDIHSVNEVPTLFKLDILSPSFRFPGPSPANSQVVRTWLALLRVWRTVDRPTAWNGQIFRAIPSCSSLSSRAPQIHFDAHGQTRTTGTTTNNTTATTTIHNYTTTQLLPSSRLWSLFLRPSLLALFLSPFILFASIAHRLSGINATRSHNPPFLPSWPSFLAIPYIILIFLSCCSGLAFVHVLILSWGKPVIWSFNPLSEKELNEKEEAYEARNALVAVVRALRERDATAARDKSFAMTGILERLGILLKPADYEKSLGEVYHELFVGLLRREPALIALLVDVDGIKETRSGAAESENVLDGAPSWVPNWSQLRTRHWINYDESIYQRLQLGTFPSSPATTSVPAHGAQSQDWRLCWIDHGQNDKALIVKAVILCQITYVSSPIGSSEFCSLSTQKIIPIQHLRTSLITIDAWLYAIKLYAPSTSPHQFNPTAIHMTLYPFNQQAPMTKPNPHSGHQEGRGRVASHFRRWNDILNGPQSEYMYSPEQRQILIDKVLQDPESRTFTHNVCERFAGDTRLFISQDDGFVGKGSRGMQKGDVVALIKGVGQPMILRATTSQRNGSGSFTVIGPAFACRLADLNTFRSSPGPGPEGGSGPGAYDPKRDGKVWRVLSLV